MDVNKIRRDFPLFDENNRKPVIYFDNACQSLRPRQVIEALDEYYTRWPACGGRSMHQLGNQVTQKCDQARADLARFLNASRKEEIVVTRNTTEGINLVANALDLHEGDAVLITDKEHNSNLIPWQMLAKRRGVQLKIVPSRADNTFDLGAYQAALDKSVRLVSVGYTSNLDGVTLPAGEIVKLAHKNGSLALLDAAQTAPHERINVRALDADFLAFSGHKMLGPAGTGVLYGKYALLQKLEPFLVGGDTVASSTYDSCEFLPPPEKFEAGLQDYAGLIGLGAAVRYLQGVGMDAIRKQETRLNEMATAGLLEIEGLHIIGPQDPKLRGGILTFYVDGMDHHRIAIMLDQMANIAVRSGQHCVHSWFNAHQVKGSVRTSLYFYNTEAEVDTFVTSLKKIVKVL